MTAAMTSPLYKELLASNEVRRAIETKLRRRGVETRDLDDLTQEVLTRALSVRPAPESLRGCVGLVRKMAKQLAIDDLRRRISRRAYDAGPCEDPDQYETPDASPGEAIDCGRKLGIFYSDVADGRISPREAEMVAMVADGLGHEEIAHTFAVKPQTVRNLLTQTRQAARTSWQSYVSAAAFAMAVLAVGWMLSRHQARPGDTHLPPRSTKPEQVRTPLQRAEELRRVAQDDCDAGKWQECLDAFDAAAELDPQGDRAPEVQRARAGAASHLAPSPKSPTGAKPTIEQKP